MSTTLRFLFVQHSQDQDKARQITYSRRNVCVIMNNGIEAGCAGKKRGILCLDIVLAAADATEAFLESVAHALARAVTAVDGRVGVGGDGVRGIGVACAAGTMAARLHFCARVAGALVLFERSLNCEGRFALALEVVRVVLLRMR